MHEFSLSSFTRRGGVDCSFGLRRVNSSQCASALGILPAKC